MALLAVAVLSLLVCGSLAEDAPSDVKVLTPENFEQEVGKEKGAFVEFYAPWCGHCKKLAPEYEKAGTAFKKMKNVVIAKVDCDEHKDLCSKYGVEGFPTLKWFPKGSLTPTEYPGGRTAEDIVKFVNEQAATNAKLSVVASEVVVLTPSNFDDIALDKSKDVLVEFYAPWCGHCKSLAPVYENVASAFRAEKDVVVAKLDADAHKDLASKYGVSGYPTLKFFPKSGKDGEDYEGGRSLEDFVTFLNDKAGTHRTPTGELTDEAGRIASVDVLVTEYLAAKSEDAIKKIEEAISKLEGTAVSYGKIYSKVLKSIASKGADYPAKEYERLKRLLAGAVNAGKADELTLKKNVISSFLAAQQ